MCRTIGRRGSSLPLGRRSLQTVSRISRNGLLLNTAQLVREQYSSHGVDEEATALDQTVSELVQKFYPSDVALPLGK